MPGKIVIIHNDPAAELKCASREEEESVEEILRSVQSLEQALKQLGYTVETLPLSPPMSSAYEELDRIEADLVFNLFEGFDGWPESESAVAHHLEDLDLCFTGCPSRSLRICENKDTVKRYLQAFNIPSPKWQVLHPGCRDEFNMGFPCIVKPVGEHSSRGLTEYSVVDDLPELRRQVEIIWEKFRQLSLVEPFLPGREFRALVTGNRILKVYPIEEIIYTLPLDKPRLLTFNAKWIPDDDYFKGTSENCPAEVVPALKEKIERMAVRSYQALDCRSYASIDMRQDANCRLMVLDVNPNTDITMGGAVRFPVEALGMDYAEFINEILGLAIEYHSETRDRLGSTGPSVRISL